LVEQGPCDVGQRPRSARGNPAGEEVKQEKGKDEESVKAV
jgi:hypothetical protein